MTNVDARGLSCPEPVILAQEASLTNDSNIEILVDSQVAKENVARFLENAGYSVSIEDSTDYFKLIGSK